MEKKGAGIWDVIKNPIETAKEVLNPIPTKLNNISRRTMEQYDNQPIQQLTILRSPLKSHWTKALNFISNGKFDELKNKYGFDKLFHLSLVALINGNPIIIEKNEVVNIAPLNTKSRMGPNTEQFQVSLQGKTITLNEMINKTKNLMGNHLFYDYSALGHNGHPTNNCQDFVQALLKSVELLTPQAQKFIKQDISSIAKDFYNDKKVDYVPDLTYKITNIGSRISRLIGKGKSKTKQKQDPLMQLVLEINKRGWEFL